VILLRCLWILASFRLVRHPSEREVEEEEEEEDEA